jgi:hypothetical protein
MGRVGNQGNASWPPIKKDLSAGDVIPRTIRIGTTGPHKFRHRCPLLDGVVDTENVIELHRIPRHHLKPVANLSHGFVAHLLL